MELPNIIEALRKLSDSLRGTTILEIDGRIRKALANADDVLKAALSVGVPVNQ